MCKIYIYIFFTTLLFKYMQVRSKNQTEFKKVGKDWYLKIVFPPGASFVDWNYPQNERVDNIKSIRLKEYCISIQPNGANQLPAGLDVVSYPSIFKSNLLYEQGQSNTDAIPVVLHRPWTTPTGNIRFSYEYSPIGLFSSQTPENSERSLPNHIYFLLCSNTFTPAVPPANYPGSIPGAVSSIPVAEESWVTFVIETFQHKQEDISNPKYSIPRTFY